MTTPLKELVAEVELLSAQATEGPWYEEAASGDRNLITAIKSGDVGATDKWVDAVFVAALRTAWPDVVKGIDDLRAEVEGTTEAFKAVVEQKHEALERVKQLEANMRVVMGIKDKLLARVHAMAKVGCVNTHGRTPMRCLPKDRCSFCRCREVLVALGVG